MEPTAKPRHSMIPFTFVVLANLVSLTGSQMTRFAVIYWAWQLTGSATAAGLIAIASFTATVVASAFAGALVDRWNRKRTIIVTDLVSGIATGGLLLLYTTGNLQVWHLGALGAVAGALESLQFPAYMSAVTTMVRHDQLTRANGMFQFVWQASMAVAPVIGAFAIAKSGLISIFTFDMLSFVVVALTVGFVTVPQPAAPEGGHGTIWQDMGAGFRYIWERPSLLGLLLILTLANIACGAYEGLFRPMVLAVTGDNAGVLGQALLWSGVGGVASGFFMSAWGGPKAKVKVPVMLGSLAVMCGLGLMVMGLGRNVWVWGAGGFAYSFFLTIANTLLFALWQQKVEPGLQGRVFNTMRLVVMASTPVAVLAATQLSDKLFEPAMVMGGTVAGLFGGLVGTTRGSGMSLVLTLGGLIGVVCMVAGFLFKPVRLAETAMPDHNEAA